MERNSSLRERQISDYLVCEEIDLGKALKLRENVSVTLSVLGKTKPVNKATSTDKANFIGEFVETHTNITVPHKNSIAFNESINDNTHIVLFTENKQDLNEYLYAVGQIFGKVNMEKSMKKVNVVDYRSIRNGKVSKDGALVTVVTCSNVKAAKLAVSTPDATARIYDCK